MACAGTSGCGTLQSTEDEKSHLPESLSPHEHVCSRGPHAGRTFPYRMLIPNQKPPPNGHPLIVWLHGYGENGDDNRAQLRWLELFFNQRSDGGRSDFFLLAMQCPSDFGGWHKPTHEDGSGDMLSVVHEAMSEIVDRFPIDRDRIYLAGISSGGDGCWHFATRHPEWFAAVAPMASTGGNVQDVCRIKETPVWAFHTAADTGAPVEGVRQIVSALEECGGRCELSETDGLTHDCWTAAFRDYDVLGWLLSQRKGSPEGRAPGAVPLVSRLANLTRLWPALASRLLPLAVLAVLIFVGYYEARRRRRQSYIRSTTAANNAVQDSPS